MARTKQSSAVAAIEQGLTLEQASQRANLSVDKCRAAWVQHTERQQRAEQEQAAGGPAAQPDEEWQKRAARRDRRREKQAAMTDEDEMASGALLLSPPLFFRAVERRANSLLDLDADDSR